MHLISFGVNCFQILAALNHNLAFTSGKFSPVIKCHM